jgi:hypothetical protein
MEIEAPNTFTPNGDGANDEFRVYYKSVKNFSMVFLTAGEERYMNPPIRRKGGTEPLLMAMADPGVYFYVIEAEGYNRNEKRKLQGPIHLIRGKN